MNWEASERSTSSVVKTSSSGWRASSSRLKPWLTSILKLLLARRAATLPSWMGILRVNSECLRTTKSTKGQWPSSRATSDLEMRFNHSICSPLKPTTTWEYLWIFLLNTAKTTNLVWNTKTPLKTQHKCQNSKNWTWMILISTPKITKSLWSVFKTTTKMN